MQERTVSTGEHRLKEPPHHEPRSCTVHLDPALPYKHPVIDPVDLGDHFCDGLKRFRSVETSASLPLFPTKTATPHLPCSLRTRLRRHSVPLYIPIWLVKMEPGHPPACRWSYAILVAYALCERGYSIKISKARFLLPGLRSKHQAHFQVYDPSESSDSKICSGLCSVQLLLQRLSIRSFMKSTSHSVLQHHPYDCRV